MTPSPTSAAGLHDDNFNIDGQYKVVHLVSFGIFVALYFNALYSDPRHEHGPIWLKCLPIWQLGLYFGF